MKTKSFDEIYRHVPSDQRQQLQAFRSTHPYKENITAVKHFRTQYNLQKFDEGFPGCAPCVSRMVTPNSFQKEVDKSLISSRF